MSNKRRGRAADTLQRALAASLCALQDCETRISPYVVWLQPSLQIHFVEIYCRETFQLSSGLKLKHQITSCHRSDSVAHICKEPGR